MSERISAAGTDAVERRATGMGGERSEAGEGRSLLEGRSRTDVIGSLGPALRYSPRLQEVDPGWAEACEAQRVEWSRTILRDAYASVWHDRLREDADSEAPGLGGGRST